MMQTTITSWCSAFVQELLALDLDYFCIAPGSRSTPLVLAIASNPYAKTFVHFDERALSFHALGYAKATKKAAVIIVTSGSACGNLLPAIMEAHESEIPLLIITADRPFELHECGANQTTKQEGMFRNFVRWEHTLPPPSPSFSLALLRSLLSHAITKIYLDRGPVHLNCQFREPFDIPFSPPIESLIKKEPKTTFYYPNVSFPEDTKNILLSAISQAKKGLLLVGSDALTSEQEIDLFSFFKEKLGWPTIADILSKLPRHMDCIRYANLLCMSSNRSDLEPDCVLHFGKAFVSKHLTSFLKKANPEYYIHISPSLRRYDPQHIVTHRILSTASEFCKQLLPLINSSTSSFFNNWASLSKSSETQIEQFFSSQPFLSEAELFYRLSELDFSKHLLFIGNSMPIRYALDFFHPELSPKAIFGNRGLSGIDGNIATATGLAQGLSSPIITIIGDQTFLHDLSSLSLIKKLNHPFILVVINNNGGNIFSFLPIHQEKTICEKYFTASQEKSSEILDFSLIAQQFDLPYILYENVEDFFKNFSSILSNSKHYFIEIKTHKDINLETFTQLQALFSDHASSLSLL